MKFFVRVQRGMVDTLMPERCGNGERGLCLPKAYSSAESALRSLDGRYHKRDATVVASDSEYVKGWLEDHPEYEMKEDFIVECSSYEKYLAQVKRWKEKYRSEFLRNSARPFLPQLPDSCAN